jgi:general secretion pathway protein G
MAYCAHCGSFTERVSYNPCPSCGKPTNGAPPRVAAAGGSNTAGIVIAVVVGGFIIVAMIGILAAIAIPNFITATERAKQRRTMADIRTLATAVEAYAVDNDDIYPRAESMEELRPLIVPSYVRNLPELDGWGNELRYRCLDEECSGYAISSSGSDKIFEHVTAAEYERKQTTDFDSDLIYIKGEFIQGPFVSGAGGR